MTYLQSCGVLLPWWGGPPLAPPRAAVRVQGLGGCSVWCLTRGHAQSALAAAVVTSLSLSEAFFDSLSPAE